MPLTTYIDDTVNGDMIHDSETGQVARLAMLTGLAVFRDIVPGYCIRLPSEAEEMAPLSKEVKNLRKYEAGLLRAYQACLQLQFSS